MDSNASEVQDKPSDKDHVFSWQDYLDGTKSSEVPQILFPHVELSLQSGIEIGMSLEVPYYPMVGEEPSYWVATVVMPCGPLLRLRYFGGDDRNLEFWCDLTKEAAHELGWCQKNEKQLVPPEVVVKRSPDCLDKLSEHVENAISIPPAILMGDGLCMTEQIKAGMNLEVTDLQHPFKIWPAIIIENVGGRLLLQYEMPESKVNTFWEFCTSERLHSPGSAKAAGAKWLLEPPDFLIDSSADRDWRQSIERKYQSSEITNNLFNNDSLHPVHNFEVGMKLAALSPINRSEIYPSTVVKVFDEQYFLVEIDVYDESTEDKIRESASDQSNRARWLCTSDHPYIFAIDWIEKHDIRLTCPKGWKSEEFDWEVYLTEAGSKAAPINLFAERENALDAGFEIDMRLEAVDPEDENSICAAHITKIVDNLLWIKLDNSDVDRPEHVTYMQSRQIFPVGWCESNSYELKPPKDFVKFCKTVKPQSKEIPKKSVLDIPISEPRSSLWCPKIYFNYRCFTGPMISKGKLATLPQAVGPGPVTLVMKEVLSMIVSVGYRSARILKLLQCDTNPDPGCHLETLKAKHKNTIYRASVAIITSGDMVAEFCKNICRRLMVCPNLFGPLRVIEDDCPDKCHKNPKANKIAGGNNGTQDKAKVYPRIMEPKPKPWRGRKKKRGRWYRKHKTVLRTAQEILSFDPLESNTTNINGTVEGIDDRPQLSEIDIMIQKDMEKSEKIENNVKPEVPSSNVSEDSRSSFNDKKSKDSNVGSPSSGYSKGQLKNGNATENPRYRKREREWDTSVESEGSGTELEHIQQHKKQRRPKTRKLESNPLFWSVDDVFRYLKKTNDCKDLAHRVRKEQIDGLAFLLLNLPSLTQHMKLRMSSAMKLCRHVEQVKVTFFLRHMNEVEPEQYQIL